MKSTRSIRLLKVLGLFLLTSIASLASELLGTWVDDSATLKWILRGDGSGVIIHESVNGNPGTLHTHIAWSSNDSEDTITYRVTRVEMKGSEGHDKSEPPKSDRTYTVDYTLSGSRWTIGGKTYVRQ